MTGGRGWLPERQTDRNGMKVLQKSIHLLIPHACTTWTCWLTIRFAFHFWGFGDRSGQPIPNLTCQLVGQIIPFDHTSAMTSHVDVMKVRFPVIEQFDGGLINFSECLLLLHSHIFAHAQTNGRQRVNKQDDRDICDLGAKKICEKCSNCGQFI